ncbi:hypothetical protein [Egbenema bharatensis]|uniref:hypothetical protein n=1 Tax=Egbenema bharatensis TaxID=3463334 RepID=UPI003A837D7E
MQYSNWQSRTALLLTVGLASTLSLPFTLVTSAEALPAGYQIGQRFPDSWRSSSLPTGTIIPIALEEGAERIIVTPNETADVTVFVANDIVTGTGRVAIRRGSQLEGQLRPAGQGTQFVANTLILENGTRINIDAVSNVITDRETISRRSNPDILRGAIIGGGAAAILSGIFGRIDAWEVLAGAGVGVLAEVLLRGRQDVEVISVRPERMDVRLRSPLALQ